MDVTEMLDTKANSGHCACRMTSYGGPAWPLRCRGQLAAASYASNMKAFVPKPQCNQSLLPHLGSCCMLTLPALTQWRNWITCKMWWTFWSFVTILQNTSWHMWPLIKLQTLLLSFCGKVTSQFSEHWPSSWVTEGPALKATSSESFASLGAYRRLDFTLPYSNQWPGRTSSPNADAHNREIK